MSQTHLPPTGHLGASRQEGSCLLHLCFLMTPSLSARSPQGFSFPGQGPQLSPCPLSIPGSPASLHPNARPPLWLHGELSLPAEHPQEMQLWQAPTLSLKIAEEPHCNSWPSPRAMWGYPQPLLMEPRGQTGSIPSWCPQASGPPGWCPEGRHKPWGGWRTLGRLEELRRRTTGQGSP